MVEWRAIPGFEGKYEVSNDGQVRSIDHVTSYIRLGQRRRAVFKGRLKKPDIDDKGYPRVSIYDHQGRSVRIHVHILVARAFLGMPPAGHECCHNDGKRRNAALSNIRYDTRKGNHADELIHGTRLFGEKSPRSKLTEAAVLEIVATPGVITPLAKKFSVSLSAIKSIRTGRTWGHLTNLKKAA